MPRIEEATLVGDIEDISMELVVANFAETPCATMMRKGKKPENVELAWPVDKYKDPVVKGVRFDKDVDSFGNTQANRAKLRGRVCRLQETYGVDTAAQEITKQAGDDGNKFEQSKGKATVELKYQWEKCILGRQDSGEGAGTDGPMTRGIGCWNNPALQVSDEAAFVTPVAYNPTGAQIFTGAIADWWEPDLKAAMQARWDNVRNRGELHGFCGSAIKGRISDFSKFEVVPGGKTLARVNENDAPIKITNMVEVYNGDFGQVTFHLDAFVPDTRAMEMIDMGKTSIRPTVLGRAWEFENKGGGRRGMVETIFALVNELPQSNCTVQATA